MTRNEAISLFTGKVSEAWLVQAVADRVQIMPFNCTLNMVNLFLKSIKTDTQKNWFTAFAVLCVYQRLLAGDIVQYARVTGNQPELSLREKKDLIEAVISGASLEYTE
jgi:hypothetical protein